MKRALSDRSPSGDPGERPFGFVGAVAQRLNLPAMCAAVRCPRNHDTMRPTSRTSEVDGCRCLHPRRSSRGGTSRGDGRWCWPGSVSETPSVLSGAHRGVRDRECESGRELCVLVTESAVCTIGGGGGRWRAHVSRAPRWPTHEGDAPANSTDPACSAGARVRTRRAAPVPHLAHCTHWTRAPRGDGENLNGSLVTSRYMGVLPKRDGTKSNGEDPL